MNEGPAVRDSRGGGRLVVHEQGRVVNGMDATLQNGSAGGRDATTLTNDGGPQRGSADRRALDRVGDAPLELEVVADLLVALTRDMAATAIADATEASGDARRLDRAVAHPADADAHQAAGDRADAVKDHRKAWQDAMHALRR